MLDKYNFGDKVGQIGFSYGNYFSQDGFCSHAPGTGMYGQIVDYVNVRNLKAQIFTPSARYLLYVIYRLSTSNDILKFKKKLVFFAQTQILVFFLFAMCFQKDIDHKNKGEDLEYSVLRYKNVLSGGVEADVSLNRTQVHLYVDFSL